MPALVGAEERPVAQWQPAEVARFVKHRVLSVDPDVEAMIEPKPTGMGWHFTRKRCLYVALIGEARAYPTNGPSVLRRRGDVQLTEDLTGRGHFNAFSRSDAGLVIYLPHHSLAAPR